MSITVYSAVSSDILTLDDDAFEISDSGEIVVQGNLSVAIADGTVDLTVRYGLIRLVRETSGLSDFLTRFTKASTPIGPGSFELKYLLPRPLAPGEYTASMIIKDERGGSLAKIEGRFKVENQ